MSDWQPIETAPKDGTDIVVVDADTAFAQVASYEPAPDPAWVWVVTDGVTYHESTFTHWMPLPEPPTYREQMGTSENQQKTGSGNG